MREFISDSGRLIVIQQDDKRPDQAHSNFVMYERNSDGSLGPAIIDEWSHFAGRNNPSPDDDIITVPIDWTPDVPDDKESSLSIPKLVAEDCNPIGMSYWRNINYHAGKSTLLAALSLGDQLYVLTIDKRSLNVIASDRLNIHHTGEGIFFSATKPYILFVPLHTGSLITVNVATGEKQVIWQSQGNKLWQVHADYYERTFSATLRDMNDNPLSWSVLRNGKQENIPIHGNPDECQVDKSGEYLLAKEDDDNRIIRLDSRIEYFIANKGGALGHSDCGFECAIGENDYSSSPGSLDLINFRTFEHRFMYSTGIWNMGYVSFTNAMPNAKGQECLISTPKQLIVVNFDWPHEARVICDNLTQSQDYEHRPKANLCPLGEFAIWTALVNNSLNAYIMRVRK